MPRLKDRPLPLSTLPFVADFFVEMAERQIREDIPKHLTQQKTRCSLAFLQIPTISLDGYLEAPLPWFLGLNKTSPTLLTTGETNVVEERLSTLTSGN